MGDQLKGMTVALLVVTVGALFVAYRSSFKVISAKSQAAAMKSRADELTKRNKDLEAHLDEGWEKYHQEILKTHNLEVTIGEQKSQMRELAREVERQMAFAKPASRISQQPAKTFSFQSAKNTSLTKTAQNGHTATSETPSSNFTPSSTKDR